MDAGDPPQPGSSGGRSVIKKKYRERKRPQRLIPSIEMRTGYEEFDTLSEEPDIFHEEPDILPSRGSEGYPSSSSTTWKNLSPLQGVTGYLSSSSTSTDRNWTFFSGDFNPSEVDQDILKKFNEKKMYNLWDPVNHNRIVLNEVHYKEFKTITYTVHLDEYHQMQSAEKLIPKSIGEEFSTVISKDLKGNWFRIPTEEDHNKYGNVSFTLKFPTLMQFFRKKGRVFQFYLLEIYQSVTECSSRFLVAEDHEIESLKPFNSRIQGGSWYTEENQQGIVVNKFATAIRSFQSMDVFPANHVVEFFLKLSDEVCEDLFLFLDPVPVDHSQVNQGGDGTGGCPRFMGGLYCQPCPYPYSEAETRLQIRADEYGYNLSLAVSNKIRTRTYSNLSNLRISDPAASHFCEKMYDSLLVLTDKKTREINRRIANHVPDSASRPIDVIDYTVDQYTRKLEKKGLDERHLYALASSGKLEMDIGEMIKTLSGQFIDILVDQAGRVNTMDI